MPEQIHRNEVTEEGALRRELSAHDRVVIAFRTEWSDRCRQLERELDAVSDTPVLVVDVDEAPMLAYRYDVTRIPTLLRLEGEEVVARSEGLPDDLNAFLGAELVH
jgi:thioredoxin-like negative regulator of GroEL